MSTHTIRPKPANEASSPAQKPAIQKPASDFKRKNNRRRRQRSDGKQDRPSLPAPPPAPPAPEVAVPLPPIAVDATADDTAPAHATDAPPPQPEDDNTSWIDRLTAAAKDNNTSDGEDAAMDAAVEAAAKDLETTLSLDEDAGAYLARLALSELISDGDAAAAVATAMDAAAPFLEDNDTDVDAAEPLAKALVTALEVLRGGVIKQRAQSAQSDDAVEALREVFPAVRADTVAEHVRKAGGDANLAAERLVQASAVALARLEAAEKAGKTVARDDFFARKLSRAERKKLFDEYHMRPPEPTAGHRPIAHADGGKRELRKQTRYRDGQVASTTGQRFLVEPKETADFVKSTSVSIRVTGGGRTH